MTNCNIDAKFYGVDSLYQNMYLGVVEENLKSFLDYGFLNIGGFVNVNIPTSGLYNTVFHKLKPTVDPGYPSNTVWQTPKKEWIWESGITYNNISPNNITGIIINGSGYPTPTGNSTYGYSLDYANGRVHFNKPLPVNANVELAYSYRWCQVTKSSNNQNWKILQTLAYQPDAQINQASSGVYAIEANHRIQMPSIVIEPIARNVTNPYELGSLVSSRQQDILCHIFTENINDRNTIMDILRMQREKPVVLYDIKKIVSSGLYGLNANGSKNPNGLNYGQILQNNDLLWNTMYIRDVNFINMEQNTTSNLFWCITRLTVEVIL